MIAWRPITVGAELPAKGTQETEYLEFKSQPWAKDDKGKAELLRDVAQFANHLGGSVVVGAVEDERGALAEYRAVANAEALVEAIRDTCYARLSPRVAVDCIVLQANPGQPVVVVNVHASVSPVAIRHQEKWEFYRRYGASKKPIDFEEVQRMLTEGRRGRLLLSKIPESELGLIRLDAVPGIGAARNFNDARVRISLAEGHFEVLLWSGDAFNFPYEFVNAVWPHHQGGWCVSLDVVLDASAYGPWSARHAH